MCVRDGDTVLWFSECVGGTLAFVSDVTVVCLIFCGFYLILEVGHRNRSEWGGCLKTDYDDSFTPHMRVKKLD